jgi:hypothetical protein
MLNREKSGSPAFRSSTTAEATSPILDPSTRPPGKRRERGRPRSSGPATRRTPRSWRTRTPGQGFDETPFRPISLRTNSPPRIVYLCII